MLIFMNEKNMQKILLDGENEKIEFKKSTAQLERALKAVCGFLNHKGGRVYFGVSDKAELIGQDVSDSTLTSLSQKIRQKIKPEISPEIKVLEIDGKKVIEVKIKKGAAYSAALLFLKFSGYFPVRRSNCSITL